MLHFLKQHRVMKKVLFILCVLAISACSTTEINPNEYSKLFNDLQARRPYPVLRKPLETQMLIKALDEKNEIVRFNAAHDLKALGPDAREAFIPLIKKFTDKDSRVAQVSFAAARRVMGDPYIPPPPASWFFGTEKVDDPVDPLNNYIDTGNEQQKIWSFMLLTKMGNSAKKSVPRALEALADSNSNIRYHAQIFLHKVDANISKKLISSLSNKKPEIRGSASLILGLRLEKSATEDIRKLLNDSDQSVRFSAAEALARLGDTSPEVSGILSSGLGTLQPTREKQVIALLNKIGSGSTVNSYYAKKVSQQKNSQSQLKTDIEKRAKVASQKVRDKLLKDREKLKRAEILTDENIRSSKVEIPKLASTIDIGTIPQRVEAVKKLSTLAPYFPEAFDPIVDALNNEHPSVRALAAKMLGELRKTEAVDNLILVLEDESVDVQDSAVAALTIIGTPEAMNAVSAFPEDMRREAVKRALRDSQGQIQALVRCSEARSLCKLVLQESGSPDETLNEEAASCAYQVQPGC